MKQTSNSPFTSFFLAPHPSISLSISLSLSLSLPPSPHSLLNYQRARVDSIDFHHLQLYPQQRPSLLEYQIGSGSYHPSSPQCHILKTSSDLLEGIRSITTKQAGSGSIFYYLQFETEPYLMQHNALSTTTPGGGLLSFGKSLQN